MQERLDRVVDRVFGKNLSWLRRHQKLVKKQSGFVWQRHVVWQPQAQPEAGHGLVAPEPPAALRTWKEPFVSSHASVGMPSWRATGCGPWDWTNPSPLKYWQTLADRYEKVVFPCCFRVIVSVRKEVGRLRGCHAGSAALDGSVAPWTLLTTSKKDLWSLKLCLFWMWTSPPPNDYMPSRTSWCGRPFMPLPLSGGFWSFVHLFVWQGPKVQREADQEVRRDGANLAVAVQGSEQDGWNWACSQVPLLGLPHGQEFRWFSIVFGTVRAMISYNILLTFYDMGLT